MTTAKAPLPSYIDVLGDEGQIPLTDAAPQLDLHDPRSYHTDLQRVIDHFNHRTPLYEEAKRFYDGDIGEIFANEWIAEILMASGNDYNCNFAGKVVDAVYDRLEIQSVLLRSPADPSISSPYINDSLDSSVTGDTGAANPTLAAGADPTLPTADTDPDPTTNNPSNTPHPAETQARNQLLGHPDITDPENASASTRANNSNAANADLPAAPVPDTDPQTEDLQRTWQKVWKVNKLDNFFPRWIKKSLMYGDGYAMVWDDGQDGVQVQVLDPLTTAVIYDEEFEDVELFQCRWFKTSNGSKRINLFYNGLIAKFVSKTHTSGEKPEDYIPYVDPLDLIPDQPIDVEQRDRLGPPGKEILAGYPFINSLVPSDVSVANLYASLSAQQNTFAQLAAPNAATVAQDNAALARIAEHPELWPVPNPHGRGPIFHLRTTDDDLYGVPEHRNAYGPQNAINKLIAVQMATTDAQGFPARYALQKSGTIDSNAFDEGDDDELPPDHATSTVEDRPGVVNLLKDVDQLIQMAPADVQGFFTAMGKYIQFMSFVTSTPMSFYDTLGQMPNAVTQRENASPLIKKCASRKRVMTPTTEALVEFIFHILTPALPAPIVHIQWAQSQMVDDLPGWQVLVGKLAAGVPFYQVMQEAGYTIAQISGWPTPSTGFSARITMVLQIAQAAQALAPAITAQVLSEQQASQLIDQMILDVRSTPTDASSRTNISFRA